MTGTMPYNAIRVYRSCQVSILLYWSSRILIKFYCDLLEDTAGCYFSWIGFHALGYPRSSFDHAPCATIDLVRRLFIRVDGVMEEFRESFKDRMVVPVRTEHDAREWITATPLALFTHTITHEFHHKGQVVWICRLMGYVPTDTDASNAFSWVRAIDAER